jgi:hypothetical protein
VTRSTRRLLGTLMFLFLLLALPKRTWTAPQETTVRGELIDVACHTKSIKAGDGGATASNHAACALKCARKGIPVGILTSSAVYTITGDFTAHDNQRLIAFVNQQVVATGSVSEEEGRRTINVTALQLAPAASR